MGESKTFIPYIQVFQTIISRNATNKCDFMFLNIFLIPFQVKKVYFWGGMAAWSG